MKKDIKSELRTTLEVQRTRTATFETLLEANYSHFFDENLSRDFIRSHQFFFTRAYHTSISSKLTSSALRLSRGLGARYVREVDDLRRGELSHMHVVQRRPIFAEDPALSSRSMLALSADLLCRLQAVLSAV